MNTYVTFDNIDALNELLEPTFKVFPELVSVAKQGQVVKLVIYECVPHGYLNLGEHSRVSDLLDALCREMGVRWMSERKLTK